MADRNPDRIPLEEVATDQRPSVRAFREAGEASYEDAASVEASAAWTAKSTSSSVLLA